MQRLKQVIIIGMSCLGLSHFAMSSPIPISQFAQCVAKQNCAGASNGAPQSLVCCKTCLSGVHFQGQKALQDAMHDHLDLVCAQFHKTAQSYQQQTSKPFAKIFLMGAYEHTSGKKGCNRNRIMWTAPINLYKKNGVISGSTTSQHGLVRVYPLASCEDGQIGDVLSNDQLNIKVTGTQTAAGDSLTFAFNIAKTSATHSQKNQMFIDLISELSTLSFNKQQQTLAHWSLSMGGIAKGLTETFSTNREALKSGWKGHTQAFILPVR